MKENVLLSGEIYTICKNFTPLLFVLGVTNITSGASKTQTVKTTTKWTWRDLCQVRVQWRWKLHHLCVTFDWQRLFLRSFKVGCCCDSIENDHAQIHCPSAFSILLSDQWLIYKGWNAFQFSITTLKVADKNKTWATVVISKWTWLVHWDRFRIEANSSYQFRFTQIMQENVLVSGEIYTISNNWWTGCDKYHIWSKKDWNCTNNYRKGKMLLKLRVLWWTMVDKAVLKLEMVVPD